MVVSGDFDQPIHTIKTGVISFVIIVLPIGAEKRQLKRMTGLREQELKKVISGKRSRSYPSGHQ